MATVLEDFTTEKQRSVVRFLRAKGLNAKDIHKEMFPLYGGKCLSPKAFHNWVKKFYQGRSKVADDARSVAVMAETLVKRLLCCEFRCNKCISVIAISDLFTDSPSYLLHSCQHDNIRQMQLPSGTTCFGTFSVDIVVLIGM
jgi:hypothetical protein